jgi:hypothetical protein
MEINRNVRPPRGARRASIWQSILILVTALALSGAFFWAAPLQTARADTLTVDGRLFGDGDIHRYSLIAQEQGTPPRAGLYTRVENGNLYVALAYSRVGNDNVFDAGQTLYMASAGWVAPPHRTAKRLTDSEYAEFTFEVCGRSWTWRQAYAYSPTYSPYVANWRSDHLGGAGGGAPPPDIVSSSAMVWNLNNGASGATPRWDVTQGNPANADREKWKSPYNAGAPYDTQTHNPNTVIGVSGYPASGPITFDSVHGWEWPVVYEFAIPLGQFATGQPAGCANPQFIISVGVGHTSPPKTGAQDTYIPLSGRCLWIWVTYLTSMAPP